MPVPVRQPTIRASLVENYVSASALMPRWLLREQRLDATHALGKVIIANGVAQAGVPGWAERFARDNRDLSLFKDDRGKFRRRRGNLAANLTAERALN